MYDILSAKRSIIQSVRGEKSSRTKKRQFNQAIEEDVPPSIAEEIAADWKEILHQNLLKMKPDAFERLTMRFLRENDGLWRISVVFIRKIGFEPCQRASERI